MSPRGFPKAWAGMRKLPACLREDETTLMMARWLGKRMFDAGWRAALKERDAQTKIEPDQRADRGEAAADADR